MQPFSPHFFSIPNQQAEQNWQNKTPKLAVTAIAQLLGLPNKSPGSNLFAETPIYTDKHA